MFVVLLAFGSLAVDVGYIMVVRNQLQNAGDAGALRGARMLYINAGQTINTNANNEAYLAAIDNLSQNEPVEVNDPTSNAGDVQRGHWSFATRTFTPNASTVPTVLWDRTTAELDADPNFINAVRVAVKRQSTPANSILSTIFGYDGFEIGAEAVAYLGFAGTLGPGEADQPIAICKQSITDFETGEYTCNTGRMIDSGGGTTHNTGGWTNFSQPCDTASVPTVRPLVCGSGNPNPVTYGQGIGTVGGMQDTIYNDLRDCWIDSAPILDLDGRPIVPWNLSLPVIDCDANNVSPCSELVGAVNLDVIWVKQSGTDPQWRDVPLRFDAGMGDPWVCQAVEDFAAAQLPPISVDQVRVNDLDAAQRQSCWSDFAQHFNLQTADGTSVGALTPSDLQKTIFFLPNCTPHEPRGDTGGENFGILARLPVLVD
jgi:Flp pilus assembly protein TadG